MKPSLTGYSTGLALYEVVKIPCSQTTEWYGTEEHQKVLADFKRAFRNAVFIPQDSIHVAKILISQNCSSHKKFARLCSFNNTKVATLQELRDICYVKEYGTHYSTYLGFAYQVIFNVGSQVRVVAFVTREQYLEGLPEELRSDFLRTPELEYYMLISQHCEELPVTRYLVNPIDAPISPDIWCLTKLLQRLSFEGYEVDIPGMFGISANTTGRSAALAVKFNNKFPALLNNQNLANIPGRLT